MPLTTIDAMLEQIVAQLEKLKENITGAFLPVAGNAGSHNSIFRGKNLGASLTAEQSSAIQAGTFDGLFVGDYWEIPVTFTYYSAATDATAVEGTVYYSDAKGTEVDPQPNPGDDISSAGYFVANNVTKTVKWRIADFDYYYHIGNSGSGYNTHHIVVVPDTSLYIAQMHITNTGAYAGGPANTSEGGYVATDLYTGLVSAQAAAEAAFGADHVPTHTVMLPTTCTGGKYTSWGWQNRKIDIMTETMVMGARAWGVQASNGYSIASQKCQLSLFRLNPTFINIRENYYLQDVTSIYAFTAIREYGHVSDAAASSPYGVRPYFCVI